MQKDSFFFPKHSLVNGKYRKYYGTGIAFYLIKLSPYWFCHTRVDFNMLILLWPRNNKLFTSYFTPRTIIIVYTRKMTRLRKYK